MTDNTSLSPGGEKKADQVEAVARAILRGKDCVIVASDEHWPATIAHYRDMEARYGESYTSFRSLVTDAMRDARAALSASKPLVVEECARVADAFAERMARASEKPHPITGKKNRIAPMKKDAAITIAAAIRALKESPSEGSGG